MSQRKQKNDEAGSESLEFGFLISENLDKGTDYSSRCTIRDRVEDERWVSERAYLTGITCNKPYSYGVWTIGIQKGVEHDGTADARAFERHGRGFPIEFARRVDLRIRCISSPLPLKDDWARTRRLKGA